VSRQLALDLHAHIDAGIAPAELRQLQAVIFAATRSLDEASVATSRKDEQTVWGVGCHPGLVGAQKAFDRERFGELMKQTAFVSEMGLDGSSRVPMPTQEATLSAILAELQTSPRIASVHSYKATARVLAALAAQPITGAVLHWWLGDLAETSRAIELGCYFSVNASSMRRSDLLGAIPLDRLLTETDHPFGDKRAGGRARPGLVAVVEEALAARHDLSTTEIRSVMWNNLARLTATVGCAALLPRAIKLQLLAG
jgi:TatD DNase family protein